MNSLVKAQLNETRKKLTDEITPLSHAQFNRKPELDSWSVAQVCHHLFLTEEATIKAIKWGLKENGRAIEERKNLHAILLDRSKKYEAPKFVEPDTGPFVVQQVTDLLSTSRNKLLQVFLSVEDTLVLAEKSVKHPVLEQVTLQQLIEQIYLHEQRHIEQIKEIKKFFEDYSK